MRKVIFLAVSFLLIFNINAQWIWQSPLPTGNPVHSIDFVDPAHGFAFDGHLLFIKTGDGGENWQGIYDLSLFDSMGDLDFINQNTGWMAGDRIIKTMDGGETWTVQYQLQDTLLFTVCFIDENAGWAAGEDGLILNTSDGGQNWQHQSCGTDDHIRCIFFFDADHGWALTSDPQIFTTTDGGETWTEQTSGLTNGGYFKSIFFTDSLHGWMAGYFWSGEGLIMNTLDGGNTWEVQDTTFQKLHAVSFCDNQYGWATGSNGKLYRTVNGGQDWIESNAPLYKAFGWVCSVNENLAWACGEDGAIIHTQDGGVTWLFLAIPPPVWYSLSSVFFVTDQLGWMAGYRDIYFTDDGGENWVKQVSNTSATLRSIFFTDLKHGWAVGYSGSILCTADGGLSWTSQASCAYKDFYSVWFSDIDNGWITGEDGTVIYTDNGGLVWTEERSESSLEIIVKNYPNPFSGFTSFEYTLEKPAYVTLEVFDYTGKIVQTIIHGSQDRGIHRATWSAGSMTPGIYFYRFKAGKQKAAGKLVFLK